MYWEVVTVWSSGESWGWRQARIPPGGLSQSRGARHRSQWRSRACALTFSSAFWRSLALVGTFEARDPLLQAVEPA